MPISSIVDAIQAQKIDFTNIFIRITDIPTNFLSYCEDFPKGQIFKNSIDLCDVIL
jgi:hypothetical protein